MRWSRQLNHLFDACNTSPYSDHGRHDPGAGRADIIDCDLGTNPLGASPRVADVLRGLQPDDVARYPLPRCSTLARRIIERWRLDGVGDDDIVFGSGSIDVLLTLLRLLPPRAIVLGPSPQFPNFPLAATIMGLLYRPVLLEAPAWRIDPAALLAAIVPGVDLVYLDRPHNPTGQVVPIEVVERLAHACAAADSLLVVDEAYGEFLDPGQSALRIAHPNLIVTRSFSKGFGLAGARIGYAVLRDRRIATVYARLHPPFEVSGPNIKLALAALYDEAFLRASRRYVRGSRPAMDAALERAGLHLAASDPCSPIVLVRSDEPDAVARLASVGIRATAGSGFLHVDDQTARVRLPSPLDLPEFLQRLERLAAKSSPSQLPSQPSSSSSSSSAPPPRVRMAGAPVQAYGRANANRWGVEVPTRAPTMQLRSASSK